MEYNVKNYGAAGDGITKDTAAIQAAVDAASTAGGGRVILPPGRYLSGKITGIRLLDSDFTVTPKTKLFAQPQFVPEHFPNHCHMHPNHFYFENALDVVVRGVTLTWNAPLYSDTWTPERLTALKERRPDTDVSLMEPKHLKAFELIGCENIRLEDNDTPAFDA